MLPAIGPLLLRELEKSERAGERVAPDVAAMIRQMAVAADAVAAEANTERTSERTPLDEPCASRIDWISVKAATEITKTEVRAVQRLCERGSLHAERDGHIWRVCRASALAKLEGKSCLH
jgi:hypothetical protein